MLQSGSRWFFADGCLIIFGMQFKLVKYDTIKAR
jgi:hypothetical protein